MKIKPRHVFALARMGSRVACAADGANASLDFSSSSLAPTSTVDRSITKAEAKARGEIEECFAAGTLVHAKDGLRPIEELKVGDLVLTWPEDKPIPKRARLPDEYIYRPVTKTFVHEDTMIFHVPLLGTGVGKDEILRVTPNHPVFSEESGWLPISALKPSYSLIWAGFSNASIRRMKHDVERVTVYNIEVEDCHTYFVGKMGLWVHNKGEKVTEIGCIRDVQERTLIRVKPDYELNLPVAATVRAPRPDRST